MRYLYTHKLQVVASFSAGVLVAAPANRRCPQSPYPAAAGADSRRRWQAGADWASRYQYQQQPQDNTGCQRYIFEQVITLPVTYLLAVVGTLVAGSGLVIAGFLCFVNLLPDRSPQQAPTG